MKRWQWWILPLLLLGIGVATPPPSPSGIGLASRRVLDTLRVTVSWTNETKVGVDSLTVKLSNVTTGGFLPSQVFLPPLPTTAKFQQPIVSKTATYHLLAQVCVYLDALVTCDQGRADYPLVEAP